MMDILTNHDVEIAYGPIGKERMRRGPNGVMAPVRMLRNGYIMRGSGQNVLMLGCGLLDENVAIENIGHINISKIIGFIKDGTFQPPVMETATVPITPDLLEAVRHHNLDEPVITGMSVKRRDEPGIILRFGCDHHVIDGRHRLERRRREGLPDVTFHVVDGTVTSMFLIFVYTQPHNGDLWIREKVDTQTLNAACFGSENSLTKKLDTRNGVPA